MADMTSPPKNTISAIISERTADCPAVNSIIHHSSAPIPAALRTPPIKHSIVLDGDDRREYAYTEIKNEDRSDWTIRNDRYKPVERMATGEAPVQELYDLEADPFEQNNRVNGIDLAATLIELQAQAALIRQ